MTIGQESFHSVTSLNLSSSIECQYLFDFPMLSTLNMEKCSFYETASLSLMSNIDLLLWFDLPLLTTLVIKENSFSMAVTLDLTSRFCFMQIIRSSPVIDNWYRVSYIRKPRFLEFGWLHILFLVYLIFLSYHHFHLELIHFAKQLH